MNANAPVLTLEQLESLRGALRTAQWEQDFDPDNGNETWFSPKAERQARVMFFCKNGEVSYSDSKVAKSVTLREAMGLAQEGRTHP